MLMLRLTDVAADLTAIKNLLIPDIVAWGVAAIGLGLTASAVLWIMRRAGFSRVEVLPPTPDACEQLARGQRVIVAGYV